MARRRQRSGLDTTAAGIGAALGRVAAKVDKLKRQRAEIAAEIQQVIGAAERMLVDLGGRAKAGRAGGGSQGAAPKRRKLSAEARERIAEAQRRRWAKVRAARK